MTTQPGKTYRLSSERLRAAREQRQSARVHFGSGVPLATPEVHEALIDSRFCVVETRDISQTGLSFYTSEVPESEALVLMMGDEQNPLYLSAVVVHCRRDADDPAQRYVVGCEFLEEIPRT